MRFIATLVLALLAAALLGSACSTGGRSLARPLLVTIAITPVGARTVSPEQVARVHEAVIPEIQRAGYSLAKSPAEADFVLLVSFTPVAGSDGGRAKISGLEPTAQFLRATDQGDTPEAKEMRRRQQELKQWIDRQASNSGL